MAVEVDVASGRDAAGNPVPADALETLLGPSVDDPDATAWRLYYCQWCALIAHEVEADDTSPWMLEEIIDDDNEGRNIIARTARDIIGIIDREEASWVFPLEGPGECMWESHALSWVALTNEENFAMPFLHDRESLAEGGKGAWSHNAELGHKLLLALKGVKITWGADDGARFHRLRELLQGVEDEDGEIIVPGIAYLAATEVGLPDLIREITQAPTITQDLFERTCAAALGSLEAQALMAAAEGYPISPYSPFQILIVPPRSRHPAIMNRFETVVVEEVEACDWADDPTQGRFGSSNYPHPHRPGLPFMVEWTN